MLWKNNGSASKRALSFHTVLITEDEDDNDDDDGGDYRDDDNNQLIDDAIALKFDRHPVKFQSEAIIQTTNLTASRFHEILR